VKDLVVLVPTRSEPTEQTTRSLAELKDFARVNYLRGCSDVTLARNLLLTRAFQAVRDSETPGLLFVDDDIVFSRQHVEVLLEHSRELGNIATAGAYGHAQGTFAATRSGLTVKSRSGREVPLFWCGAGFLFIPRDRYLMLASQSRSVFGPGREVVQAFTTSEPGEQLWMSEDYRLCQRLGGVALVCTVGHVKPYELWPDARDFAKLVS
jgi:hypothetical protein